MLLSPSRTNGEPIGSVPSRLLELQRQTMMGY